MERRDTEEKINKTREEFIKLLLEHLEIQEVITQLKESNRKERIIKLNLLTYCLKNQIPY